MRSKLFCASLRPLVISVILAWEQAVHLEKSRSHVSSTQNETRARGSRVR